MTIAIKPTASGSTIEQDGSTVLSIESDRSVDIDSGTLHVDATNNRVGIGTSSPSHSLTINKDGTAIRVRTDDTNSSTFNVGINASSGIAYLESSLIGSGSYVPMTFYSGGSERMRIDSSGNCFWNGTSIIENTKYNFYFTSATNGIGSKVDTTSTSYHVRWHNPNGVVGGIYTSGSNTTYTTSSDYRLKENILPMTGALDKVMQLNPVTYTWKLDGSNGQGFIAHELQSIVPECVGGEKDAVNEDGSINPQGVDTSFLVATLTAAIKELKTENDTLKSQLSALETRIQALESV